MIRRGGLFFKYAVPVVILVSSGLVVGNLVELYFSYQDSKAALGRLQREKAIGAAARIEQFVRELEHQLGWIAQTPWGPHGVPLEQRRLDSLRLLRDAPTITEVSNLDPKGHEQLRVSRLAMDVIGSNADFSGEPKFKEAIAHKTYFSQVYFRKESEPYMTIALAGSGDDAGVVVAEANLKFIWDVVSAIQVGKAGYAYVVDKRGRLIAHPDISLVLQKTDLSTLPQVRDGGAAQTTSEQPEQALVGKDLQGREVLSAHAAIPALGWLVYVDLPLKEAFAPIYSAVVRTMILIAVGLVITFLASLVLARRMVQPIKALQTGASRIASGALDHRIDVHSNDELQALAEEFNQMAARLQESYSGLERKVEERTSDLKESLEQQTATSEILRVISQSRSDVQPVFDTIAERARLLSGAAHVGLTMFDGELIHIVAFSNVNADEAAALRSAFPRPPGRDNATSRSILDREVVIIEDVRKVESYGLADVAAVVGFLSALAVPILRDGRAVGGITIMRKEAGTFSTREIAMLKTFADQAVIAIENVRLFKELQESTRDLATSVEQLRSLADVSQAVSSTLDLEEVLSTIVEQAVRLSAADGGAIYEADEAATTFRLRATYGLPEELIKAMQARPLLIGEGATGRAAALGEPVQIPDLRADITLTGRLPRLSEQTGFRALLAVPLMREGRVFGSLSLSRNSVGQFPQEVVDLLQTFAGQSTLAIQNARLFREIEQKSRELEIASQHKSQFLANMSHELRTPLNAILGYTELIVDKIYGDVPEKIGEVLERVQNSGRHLLDLINDVLDLSKIEAGQLSLGLSEYSIQDTVQAATSAVASLAAEKQLRLSTDVAADLPIGRGDERRIRQVLLNLLGNAIKFTDAGEVAVRVSNSDGVFVVSVLDTGPGIAEAERERIFEEFQQVDNSPTRAKGGSGLGLAIAKRIVELHGGRIWVESTVGRGSTFFFSIPVRAEEGGTP